MRVLGATVLPMGDRTPVDYASSGRDRSADGGPNPRRLCEFWARPFCRWGTEPPSTMRVLGATVLPMGARTPVDYASSGRDRSADGGPNLRRLCEFWARPFCRWGPEPPSTMRVLGATVLPMGARTSVDYA